ncbi:MAG: WYL domain-containing protein [Bacteroidales bacterium]|nr:WYL domain-containing protein [Bacteroidales bacterium]
MPLNKNASFRYRVINNCLRNQFRQWTLDDLISEVSEQMYEQFGNTTGVSKRTIQSDLNIMRSDPPRGFAAPIVCSEGCYYYDNPDYSIDNNPLNDTDLRNLKDAADILRQFKGLPYHIEISQIISKIESTVDKQKIIDVPLIHFEYNDMLKGQEFLQPLLKLIQVKNTAVIVYQPFTTGEPMSIMVHPYFLKEYNNRWYVFGLEHDPRRLINLALDRMISVNKADVAYIPNHIIYPGQYFNDIIGVTYYADRKKEKIVLRFSPDRAPYVKTKPMHSSQQIVAEDKDGTTISIEVIPNKELIRDILSFGCDVKVLEPLTLSGLVRGILKKAVEAYT